MYTVYVKIKFLIPYSLFIFSDSAEQTYKNSFRQMKAKIINERLNIIRNGSDLINAVNWMPSGFLWSGYFTPRGSGVCGTISSVVGIYQYLSS